MGLRRTGPPARNTPLETRTPLRRTGGPERRTAPLARGSGPSPVSAKRRAENAVRNGTTRQQVTDRSGGMCEAWIVGTCDRRACDLHEMRSRGRGGSITDPANILHVCRSCHDVITVNPAWAESVGFTWPAEGPHVDPPWPPRPTAGP